MWTSEVYIFFVSPTQMSSCAFRAFRAFCARCWGMTWRISRRTVETIPSCSIRRDRRDRVRSPWRVMTWFARWPKPRWMKSCCCWPSFVHGWGMGRRRSILLYTFIYFSICDSVVFASLLYRFDLFCIRCPNMSKSHSASSFEVTSLAMAIWHDILEVKSAPRPIQGHKGHGLYKDSPPQVASYIKEGNCFVLCK